MASFSISVRSKVIICVLLSGLATLAAGGVIGYTAGANALTNAVEQKLIAQRETKRNRIQLTLKNQLRFTKTLASAAATTSAAIGLTEAFHQTSVAAAADAPGLASDTAALQDYYAKNVFPAFKAVTGTLPTVDSLAPADAGGRRLQANYLARNPSAPHAAADLDKAGDTQYDLLHARYHPLLRQMADTVGFSDILLIDAATGDVVYSEKKGIDFASNMLTGPFAHSAVNEAVRRALDPRNGGKPILEDYSAYMPAGFAPTLFAAAPITFGGKTIAVFVAQIDTKLLDNVLTDGRHWRDAGQGETGEVLLVGQDKLFRSQSRFLETDPEKFLHQISANGEPASVVDQVRNQGTTLLTLTTLAPFVDLALRNETGVVESRDTRGVPVVAAYGPLETEGLRWVIEAKQDVAEAYAPLARMARYLLVAAGAAAVALTVAALVLSSILTRPLHRVIDGMRQLTAGERVVRLDDSSTDEYGDLARGFNTMAAAIEERDTRIAVASETTDNLLRRLYPSALFERARSGTELTAETVANTTVVVTWMDGLDRLAGDRSAQQLNEELSELLDALNASAPSFGVETVGSLGEVHVSVCGLSAARLDHATSALAWTRSATLALRRLDSDWARSIDLHFGIASGPVDVLMLRRGNAAYDMWGRTLSVARRLAMEAAPGSVLVDDTTYGLLPNADDFEPYSPIVVPALGTLTAWSRPALPEPRDRRETVQDQPASAAA